MIELFGAAGCPYTGELREDLMWNQADFIEHDVERDPEALHRMLALTGGDRTVPVLVENGAVIGIGWQGRGCVVLGGESSP